MSQVRLKSTTTSQLLFLFFGACSTRQIDARFDDEPSKGNDRSALQQREVLPQIAESRPPQ